MCHELSLRATSYTIVMAHAIRHHGWCQESISEVVDETDEHFNGTRGCAEAGHFASTLDVVDGRRETAGFLQGWSYLANSAERG